MQRNAIKSVQNPDSLLQGHFLQIQKCMTRNYESCPILSLSVCQTAAWLPSNENLVAAKYWKIVPVLKQCSRLIGTEKQWIIKLFTIVSQNKSCSTSAGDTAPFVFQAESYLYYKQLLRCENINLPTSYKMKNSQKKVTHALFQSSRT